MSIDVKTTEKLIKEYGRVPNDTGSPETQVAIFTHRIHHLTEHVKQHHHDFATRRGLVDLVNKRRKLLKYLKREDSDRYLGLIKRLKLRDSY